MTKRILIGITLLTTGALFGAETSAERLTASADVMTEIMGTPDKSSA
ncbi:MAG TPA: hypothetical protein VG273_28580 [Bryobacteraceae bacterium]|nr:hypothetical protein [Bryobacteraceae bacterium]